MEDRACPVISSKYLSKLSTHHTDAFFPEHIKLWGNLLNTRVFFQGISYLMVFWFCFSCLSKSENLILVDCGESNWPVAGFVSDSGYYSPGTNTPTATHCGKRFMPPKKSKKYMYNGAPNHWDVTQTKLKIKPIKVEKIWKWILSLRVLVAYLDISDSKEAERTHQKEMGKVQEFLLSTYITSH